MGTSFKASFFYQDDTGCGWSENFYLGATDIDTAAGTVAVLIPELVDLRPPTVAMIYGRVSDIDVRGDSKLITAIQFPQQGTYTMPTGATQEEASVSLLVQLISSPTQKNHWFLRGLPSNILDGRFKVTDATWDANFLTAATEIITNYSTYAKNPSPPPAKILTAITAVNTTRGTTRKVGRPFGLPRGRAKVP